jgi:hypothetical protein
MQPPNPLPLMRETAKYHREQSAFHEHEASKWEASIATLTEKGAEAKSAHVPVPQSHPALKVESDVPLPAKITKGKFIEETIRASGLAGISALDIRQKAKQKAMKIAPNFPYRQMRKLLDDRKVWKDKKGLYFHSEVLSISPSPQGSAQEVVTH